MMWHLNLECNVSASYHTRLHFVIFLICHKRTISLHIHFTAADSSHTNEQRTERSKNQLIFLLTSQHIKIVLLTKTAKIWGTSIVQWCSKYQKGQVQVRVQVLESQIQVVQRWEYEYKYKYSTENLKWSAAQVLYLIHILSNQHEVTEVKNIGTLLTVFLTNITVHIVIPSTKI